jgi:S-adenosylmethionine hydrolase
VARTTITFMSDYGWQDEFVGICHGVIAQICPDCRVIDLHHGIGHYDVRSGALTLRAALPYMPAGVVLAVVDPDVGAARRAVAVRSAEDRLLVGPDNGLLSLSGPFVEAVDIARSPFRLEPVSATFHGRDIFAPVAARLAAGEPLGSVGQPLDVTELVSLSIPRAQVVDGAVLAHALYVDRFGNVELDASHEDLRAVRIHLGDRVSIGGLAAHYVRTFAEVPRGELLLYEDARGSLAVAVSRGDAAAALELNIDDELWIKPAA